jgi:branched-chain amino acid transport system substrate-binding protein
MNMLGVSRASLVLSIACSFGVSFAAAQDKNVKLGVLTDMTGVYSDVGGQGSIIAAQMAVEDSGLIAKGWKIAVVSADHQNKPDAAVNVTRKWADQDKVDIVLDVVNSGVGLAINKVAREKNIIYMNSGAATSDLTNSACSPNTVSWTYDT